MTDATFVNAPVLVPVAHVFDAGGGGPFDLYEFGGERFEVDFPYLDLMLRGRCLSCEADVDHRRGVELGDNERLPIEVAVFPRDPSDPSVPDRLSIGGAIAAGWDVGPICDVCRRNEVSVRIKSFLDKS